MKKIKIGMLVHNPPFQGGIVQYCVLLVNSMKDYVDYDLVGFKKLYPPLLYKGKLPKENKSNIQFYKESNNFITWYNPFSWIKAYNRLKDSDIIHLHWVSPLLTPLQYTILILNKIFSKKKTVLTCHNIEPHESTFLDKIFTKAVFSNIDYFIVHSEQSISRLVKDYNISSDRVHFINHGTFDYFKNLRKKSKKELRKEFGFKEDDKIILFFGYIRKYKGLTYLLKAMPEIIKKEPKAKLVIAGELWEKWSIYKYIIEKENLSKLIKIFPNYILDKDVYKFFDLSDILVLPYHNTEQTISGPFLVGLAFNKPTIISNVGGISEIVKNMDNALLIESGNTDLLAKNVVKLLNDAKLQKKLEQGAKEKDKSFSWDLVSKRTFSLYKNILRK
jgi:glycosyltransferase involved in cell wall biosynthesis